MSCNLVASIILRNKSSKTGAVALRYFTPRWRITKWSNKQQISFTHKPNLTKNISMEILSKQFKPINLEINQFENRHTNLIN